MGNKETVTVEKVRECFERVCLDEGSVQGPIVNGASTEGYKVDMTAFNLCSECGDQLTHGEDGYGTEHGTCDVCAWEEE